MASVSISHFILFIASLVVAAGVAGTLTTGVDRLGSAIDDESDSVSQEIRTDVEIISDPTAGVYNSGNESVTVYVKNTGTRNLPVDESILDVLVDGTYVSSTDLTAVETTDGTWTTGDVAELTIDVSDVDSGWPPDSDHRLKLIVGGDEEVFVFRA